MLDVNAILNSEAINLKNLALAWYSFQELTQGTALNLREVADKLKMPKDSLYRAVREVEERLGQGRDIFRKATGRGATKPLEGADDFFSSIEVMLECYQRLLQPGTMTLRLGASRSCCTYLVPSVLRSFSKLPDAQDVRVDVHHGLDESLRERGRNGELDLILTTCPPDADLDQSERSSVWADVKLEMYLVCRREDELATRPRFDWEDLSGRTVVLLTENRKRRYPMTLIPRKAKLNRVESQLQAYYTVIAGGETVCFGFPQLFGPPEHDFFDHVRIPELSEENRKVRLCLLRSHEAQRRRSKNENEVIKKLANMFKERLDKIHSQFNKDEGRRHGWTRGVYHGSTYRDDNVWLGGELTLRFTEDGHVKGTHVVHERDDGLDSAIKFSVFGHVSPHSSDGTCQLVLRGKKIGDDVEDYQASFVCDERSLRFSRSVGPLVGCWFGVQTFPKQPGAMIPSGGYMVVIDGTSTLTTEQLEQHVARHERYGPLRLEKPKKIQSHPKYRVEAHRPETGS